jgi:hypothetical protein
VAFKGMSRTVIVDQAVAESRTLLGSSRVPGGDLQIHSIFWYGAVDIDAKHCVVWVILSGPGEDQVPPWFFPSDSNENGPFKTWAASVQSRILECFANAGWKDSWPPPRVGFESDDRVRAGGGLFYFK